jgi:hypothetical protein
MEDLRAGDESGALEEIFLRLFDGSDGEDEAISA